MEKMESVHTVLEGLIMDAALEAIDNLLNKVSSNKYLILWQNVCAIVYAMSCTHIDLLGLDIAESICVLGHAVWVRDSKQFCQVNCDLLLFCPHTSRLKDFMDSENCCIFPLA